MPGHKTHHCQYYEWTTVCELSWISSLYAYHEVLLSITKSTVNHKQKAMMKEGWQCSLSFFSWSMSCQLTAAHVSGLLVGIQDASYRPGPPGSRYGGCRNESQTGVWHVWMTSRCWSDRYKAILYKAKLTYNIYIHLLYHAIPTQLINCSIYIDEGCIWIVGIWILGMCSSSCSISNLNFSASQKFVGFCQVDAPSKSDTQGVNKRCSATLEIILRA